MHPFPLLVRPMKEDPSKLLKFNPNQVNQRRLSGLMEAYMPENGLLFLLLPTLLIHYSALTILHLAPTRLPSSWITSILLSALSLTWMDLITLGMVIVCGARLVVQTASKISQIIIIIHY